MTLFVSKVIVNSILTTEDASVSSSVERWMSSSVYWREREREKKIKLNEENDEGENAIIIFCYIGHSQEIVAVIDVCIWLSNTNIFIIFLNCAEETIFLHSRFTFSLAMFEYVIKVTDYLSHINVFIYSEGFITYERKVNFLLVLLMMMK